MTEFQAGAMEPTYAHLCFDSHGAKIRYKDGNYPVYTNDPPSMVCPVVANTAMAAGTTMRYQCDVYHPAIRSGPYLQSIRHVRAHENFSPLEMNVMHLILYRFTTLRPRPELLTDIFIELDTNSSWNPLQSPLKTATVRVSFESTPRGKSVRIGVVGIPYIQANGVKAADRMRLSFPESFTEVHRVVRGDRETGQKNTWKLRLWWHSLAVVLGCVNSVVIESCCG
ncbi:hypothetical protein J8273_2107 [Carpediemonas membranifera]|uniref:Uncharacterized protein n=1 Tax=Carpediemonas membranifera TaxID=201153 RepID=A0A8J6AW85_9EUKA|nr:hypothetical protein J8273_2107 [Carpediemonas membranifera]|eukprot:KAG9396376.1 hypothetical protein J8273_2107 [Carpediemonas membranifera]